ncbi:histone deacetylase [Gregarina niphandrodes]|uniref:Histone deacetylase n=1 Tax=Gregarina niphandrodes TaxID=110365 RepID=A0A023BCA4_GRENI|nr:histone deacetylase [Gregarina niphandrodes]EZG83563.1 histone deacetylase [Gregarina niphandrodes]|eukprot:XP_011128924.1 histone deacetylase [Gregarina niphandrodes]
MEFDPTVNHSYAVGRRDYSQKVAYFYDPDIGSYYYGPGHPMKPQRIRMAHSLILSYGLYKHMDVFRPHDAGHVELAQFHDSEYVNFLSEITVDNFKMYGGRLNRFNLSQTDDCPVFDGLFEFQSSCAGATIDSAMQLNHRNCDIAVNWSGGLHHAKRSEAAGFCYVNDIVLGILELLKYHARVMYIDIDVHHGDGVEEAFYLSHRVMTVSFHKYGEFFPGTGDVVDVGAGAGRYYAVNVPLDDGITDEMYVTLYKQIIQRCVDVYRPEAIVLQCGADSITGDRLGNFNMTTKGHGACVQWTKSLGIPLIILGGGGYTIRNVARAWVYETAVALGKHEDIDNRVPVNEYYEYFGPHYNLHLEPDPTSGNKNSEAYVQQIKTKIFKHLAQLEHAPSVQFSRVPADFFTPAVAPEEDEDEIDQYTVEWEGGGLADIYEMMIPHRLRRANVDDYDDRDQSMKHLEIAKGHTDLIVNGD